MRMIVVAKANVGESPETIEAEHSGDRRDAFYNRFYIAAWCNGSTPGFDPASVGSSPVAAAICRVFDGRQDL